MSQTSLIVLLLLAATTVGLVLSLLLLGATDRYGGPLGGEWWFPLFAATAVVLGWVSSRVLKWPLSLVAAAVVGPMVVGTVLLVKVLRWPEWPAVTPSNGLPSLLAIWSIAGVAAALIPTTPPQGQRRLRGLFIGTVLGGEIVGATLFAFVLGLFVGS